PPLIALAVIIVCHENMDFVTRVKQLLIGIAPVAMVAGIYVFGRLGWLAMAGTSGAVMRPTPDRFGWWFLALSLIGLALMATQRRGRGSVSLGAACLLQMVILDRVAAARGADAPYNALKMVYFVIYLQAVAAAVALADGWRLAVAAIGRASRRVTLQAAG